MRTSYLVVGGWAVANLALTAVMLVFRPMSIEVTLHVVASVLVAGFAVAVLLAVRAGRVGVQQRQPRHAYAAALLGAGTVIGLTGFALGWWISVFALFPLLAAAWLLPTERLERSARPWPVAADDVGAAGRARRVHDGSSLGRAEAVPDRHPAHAPPARTGTASGPARVAALLIAGVGAGVGRLRGRRR